MPFLMDRTRIRIPVGMRFSRAVLYGAQVFLSFFLMLIFMTYNVRHHLTGSKARTYTSSQ